METEGWIALEREIMHDWGALRENKITWRENIVYGLAEHD